MKCEKIIHSYLEQEESRYPSLRVRLHLLLCSSCREEVRGLQKVFVSARVMVPFQMTGDLSNAVIRKIYNSNQMYGTNADFEKNISPSKWFYSGVILFASIMLVSYSESFISLRKHLGSSLEIPLNIVLGLIITVYAASYIATHLEALKKFAEFINNKIH
jgi:hypothetical protein